MKAVKIVAILLAVYVGIVVLFESMLGYFQPEAETTIVITTFDEGGQGKDRVVAGLESDGHLYVAANHWPRAWYYQVLDNPKMQVTANGQTLDHTAVLVTGEEHERVNSEHSLPLLFRFLTGFPPRYLVRLDPN